MVNIPGAIQTIGNIALPFNGTVHGFPVAGPPSETAPAAATAHNGITKRNADL
jgi:hypothetical protein